MKGFKLTDKDIYELKIAAWLHDCGKIITPENVVDKSTKLECIYDRIETVNTRIESLKKDLEIDLLHKKIGILEKRLSDNNSDLESEHKQKLAALEDDRIFLHKANIGGEFMSDEARQRVTELGQKTFNSNGKKEQLLTKDEIYNLCIPKGTLTDEERQVINHHIVATIKMLESLPFPKHLSNVAEYAGGHHERMNGKGYPKGLTKEQMSVQARMMGIADIFEALTARDRPYKKGMLLSDALRIMGKMRQDNHIDGDLFDIFIKEKIYLGYATKFLEQEQIDDILHEEIPGYGA